MRSDAYVLTEDFRLELAPERDGVPPVIKLDRCYEFVDGMDSMIPKVVPSLIGCKELEINGPIEFEAGVVTTGNVEFRNRSSEKKIVKAGTHGSTSVQWRASVLMTKECGCGMALEAQSSTKNWPSEIYSESVGVPNKSLMETKEFKETYGGMGGASQNVPRRTSIGGSSLQDTS